MLVDYEAKDVSHVRTLQQLIDIVNDSGYHPEDVRLDFYGDALWILIEKRKKQDGGSGKKSLPPL